MTTVFHEGDRVEGEFLGTTFLGTVVSIDHLDASTFLHLRRDDGMTGGGPDGTWVCWTHQCKLIARPAAFTGEIQPIAEEKKGWTPDGFDASAHRDFMRNLGSSS